MEKEFKTRKEIRMKNFDYSRNGLYFITICTKDRIPYLCTICDDSVYVGADIIRPIVNLTKTGNMTEYSMNQINKHYDDVNVLKYCIMPDHIHIIISIMHDINTADCGRIISAPTGSIETLSEQNRAALSDGSCSYPKINSRSLVAQDSGRVSPVKR